MRPPRPPAVAGQFYAASGAALAQEVEAAFLDARGPGHLPTHRRAQERHIRAAIVPHAGFRYSGPIAARAYDALASDAPAATTLILGVDHHGSGGVASLSDDDWETPLGIVRTDHELVHALAQEPIQIDEAAHASEHSIEVQLPFLQYVEPFPRIVAMTVRFGPLAQLRQVAERVREAITGRDLVVLASTDFSHYVPAETARALDHEALAAIVRRDPAGLYRTVQERDISMCGIAPTTVLLEALQGEALHARLLSWGHSGEAERMREVVGYASVLFETAPRRAN